MRFTYLVSLCIFLSVIAVAQEKVDNWQTVYTIPSDDTETYDKDRVTLAYTYKEVQKATASTGNIYRVLQYHIHEEWNHYTYLKFVTNFLLDTAISLDIYAATSIYSNRNGHVYSSIIPYRRNQNLNVWGPMPTTMDNYKVDTLLSRKELVSIYLGRKKSKNGFIAAVDVMPAFANSIDNISKATYNYSNQLYRRREQEKADLGWNADVQVGWRFSRTQSLFAEGNVRRMGFRTEKMGIDWSNGLPATGDTGNYHHQWNTWGVGIGYGYSGYAHICNWEFQSVLGYNWLDNYNGSAGYSGFEAKHQLSMKNRYVTAKVALGCNIRWRYRMAVRILPTVIYSFTNVHDQVLYTRLLNYGLTVGISGITF